MLNPEHYRNYLSRPERLIEIVEGNADKEVIIIDEIQKIPSLLDVIHLLMERKLRKQYILTGSSSRKLKRSGVDLLAGRAVYKMMHPFMACELK